MPSKNKKFKKISFRLIQCGRCLTASFLSLIGFHDCQCIHPNEYGTPHATYTISGSIKAVSTQNVIPHIKVSLIDTCINDTKILSTTATDSAGRYAVSVIKYPDTFAWKLQAADTDGAQNGSFAPHDTLVTFTPSDLSGGDGKWDKGHAQKNISLYLNDATE